MVLLFQGPTHLAFNTNFPKRVLLFEANLKKQFPFSNGKFGFKK